jgi:hypothetical protein
MPVVTLTLMPLAIVLRDFSTSTGCGEGVWYTHGLSRDVRHVTWEHTAPSRRIKADLWNQG